MLEYYAAITLISLMSMTIMLVTVGGNNYLPKNVKRGFIFTFGAIAISAMSEFLGVYLDGATSNLIWMHVGVKFLELSVAPFIPVICANTIFEGNKIERKCVETIVILHVAVQFVSLFNGWIFSVDSNNMYHHEKYYSLYMLTCLISIIFLFKGVYLFSKKYQNKKAYSLVLILLFIISGIAVQTMSTNIRIDWIIISVASTFIYIYYNEVTQHVDGLTQMLNQKSFLNHTANLLNPATIIVFDIDNFKSINDEYGHQYGNQCLTEVAEMIRKIYSKYGMCYRIGGDEFAVILSSNYDITSHLNSEFKEEQKIRKEESEKFPSVSLGHELFNPEYDVITDVIERADKHMYQNKIIGKQGKTK